MNLRGLYETCKSFKFALSPPIEARDVACMRRFCAMRRLVIVKLKGRGSHWRVTCRP